MRHLILVLGLIAAAFRGAHAQAPAPFCMPQSTAQAVAAALQQDAAVMALLQDAAAEPQRQAAAVAAAVAKQKADDATAAKPSAPAEPPKP